MSHESATSAYRLSDREWEISGTFNLSPDSLFPNFDVGREVKIYGDRPMVFFKRWFYRLRERLAGRAYPSVVVWSGRIGSVRWDQEAENQWSMTGQVERVDLP